MNPSLVEVEDFSSAPQPKLFTGNGLTLRPWELGDAPVVFEAYGDPQIRWWHIRTASLLDEVCCARYCGQESWNPVLFATPTPELHKGV